MKKNKIITILNQKGGSGKSTVALNLAIQLAKKEVNKNVLLVEFDDCFSCSSNLNVSILKQEKMNLSSVLFKGDSLKSVMHFGFKNNKNEFLENLFLCSCDSEFKLKVNEYDLDVVNKRIEKIFNVGFSCMDYIVIDFGFGYINSIGKTIFNISDVFVFPYSYDVGQIFNFEYNFNNIFKEIEMKEKSFVGIKINVNGITESIKKENEKYFDAIMKLQNLNFVKVSKVLKQDISFSNEYNNIGDAISLYESNKKHILKIQDEWKNVTNELLEILNGEK